jgi:hypothetical protein
MAKNGAEPSVADFGRGSASKAYRDGLRHTAAPGNIVRKNY